MRSFVISAIIICILIAIWYGLFTFLDTHIDDYQAKIKRIEKDINNEDWESALNTQKALHDDVKKNKTKYMYFLNHGDIDNVLASVDRISSFISTEEKGLALAECSTLKVYLEQILEKHSLSIVNIM